MKISYIIPITQSTGPRLVDTTCAFKYLAETFDSILKQSIPNWELIVVSEYSLKNKVALIYEKALKDNYSQKKLPVNNCKNTYKNIQFTSIKSTNLAFACNKGLELAKGQFVATIQAGDKIAEFTTYELIKCLVENPKAQYIYTDHDHIDLRGVRFKPFFKPDLSPDLLYCQNYINNLVLIKKSLLRKIGGWNKKYDSAYDYELNLRAISNLIKLDRPNSRLMGNKSPIKHIPQIMYHQLVYGWASSSKNNSTFLTLPKVDEDRQSKQGLEILKIFFKKERMNVNVKEIKKKLYRPYWKIQGSEPLVSLIIPTRDGYPILKTCIESILSKTTYKNYEILIVDNQSKDKRVIDYMNVLATKHKNIRILNYNKPFNYSAINNYAAGKAKGLILGLINNDTEVITPRWLTEMVSLAIRPEIGAVGAMLYYPDKTIQHGGVVVGMHGVADHAFKGLERNSSTDYHNYFSCLRNPKAVTAAVLVIEKRKYLMVGGLNAKKLKIEFNDLDLCLKLLEKNFWNIFHPDVELFHHESKTRLLNSKGMMNNQLEKQYIISRWSTKNSNNFSINRLNGQ